MNKQGRQQGRQAGSAGRDQHGAGQQRRTPSANPSRHNPQR